MRHRAFTMIETLLSVSLLALLMLGVGAWTNTAGRLGSSPVSDARWDRAAAAALELIGQDVRCGDFTSDANAPRRVRALGDRLIVTTRIDGTGEVEREYRVQPTTNRLVVIVDRETRVLLDGVASLVCTLNEETRILDVRIEHVEGTIAHRSYVVP